MDLGGNDDFFYPHTLQRLSSDGVTWVNVTKCRSMPNKKGSFTTLADSSQYFFKNIIRTKRSIGYTFKVNETIRVLGPNNHVRLKADVVEFSIEDMECLIGV